MDKLTVTEPELTCAMPRFLLDFEITTCGVTTGFFKIVNAATPTEATEKARGWMRGFWLESSPNPSDPDIVWNATRTATLELCSVKPATLQEILNVLTIDG